MILSFHPCIAADVQTILGDRSLGPQDHRVIQRADAIILPQALPRDLYEACRQGTAKVFPSYGMRFQYPYKRGQVRLFEAFHCPFPRTLSWSDVLEFREATRDSLPHPFPFFIKADQGHEGQGVFIIKDRASLERALEHLQRVETSGVRGFLSQDHVPCGGNVLRAVLLGRRVITYWKRSHGPETQITTISRGAYIDHKWRPDLQEEGKSQALILSAKTGIDLAAMDFVFSLVDDPPKAHFLEINYYFGRKGLGGSLRYYQLLFQAIQEWLREQGLDPKAVRLL